MNIRRNVFSIVAGALLMASLPAGAQVLGGSVGGAMNGALGGRLAGAGFDGSASAAGNAGFDASGAFGAAHGRMHQAGDTTRAIGGRAVGSARADVATARGMTETSVQTAHSAGARVSRRAARSAAQTSASAEQSGFAQANTQPGGELLLNGSGGASTEKHAFGRTIAAEGVAGGETSADRSGVTSSAFGQGSLSMKKDEPAPAEATPAK